MPFSTLNYEHSTLNYELLTMNYELSRTVQTLRCCHAGNHNYLLVHHYFLWLFHQLVVEERRWVLARRRSLGSFLIHRAPVLGR